MSSGIVLDASTTLAWAFEDEADVYADVALEHLIAHFAVVPQLWKFELVNGLVSGVRRRRITIDQAVSFLAELEGLDIRTVDGQEPPEVLLHDAVEFGLTSYDAAYVSMARNTALPLTTMDRGMRKAAKHAGVAVFA
jgi:predicted nucleic acid-binding protein